MDQTAIVGRREELQVLLETMATLRDGRSAIVVIEGEPGIGKTRLLSEALASPSAKGIEIRRAAAAQLDQARPFGPLVDAYDVRPTAEDPTLDRLATLLYGHGDDYRSSFQVLDASQSPYRVEHAFLELIEERSSLTPTVLAIEDLQWVDPSTLLALRDLARRMDHLRLALIVTARPAPRSHELQLMLEELNTRGARRLLVGPLDDDATMSLAAGVAGARVGEGLHRQIARAEGNPFYVIELVHALAQDGAITIDQGTADSPMDVLPPDLRLTLLRRLTFLSKDALELLKTAAVLGRTFDVSTLSAVVGRSAAALLPAIDEALSGHLIEPAGSKLAFRHDLIRESIYEDLPLALRKALHQQIARTLAERGASPIEVAEHFLQGASERDPEAVRWLREAAIQASSRSPAVAVELLRRAVELMDVKDPERDEVLAELVLSLLWSGHLEEGEELARRVLERPLPPDVYVRVELGLTYLLIIQDRVTEFVPHIESLADRAELPPYERAQLRAEVGFGRLLAADLEGAELAARLAIDEGEVWGNDAAASLGLATLSWRAYSRGLLDDALELGEKAVERAERSEMTDSRRQHPHLFLGMVYMGCDRFDDAEAVFAKGLRIGEEMGTVWDLPIYHCGLALRRFYSGQWDDALSEAEAGIAFADEFGTRTGISFLYALNAHISVRRGDLARAKGALDAMESRMSPEGARFGTDQMMWAQAMFLEASGNDSEALSVLEAAWDLHSAFKVNTQYRMGPHLVRLALSAGKVDRAQSVASDLDEVAAVSRTHSARGTALRCRGMVRGDPELVTEAVDEYDRGPRVVETAGAAEDAAAVLARAGRTEEARSLIARAIETYETLDARWDLNRSLAVERTLGVRRGRRGSRVKPTVGWESLTETERTVADLAAEGLTNRQIAERLFLSPRTVQTHLSHVFGKLGVASRTKLIAEAARR